MSLLLNNRAPKEHLVFVKNVPSYLAKDTIPKLFTKYNPIHIKNVYPKSHITTVVIAFRTQHEAACAQQDTDQMRISNVVLRVEGYNKLQSVRHLREQAHTNRSPLGLAVEDDDDEDTKHEEVLPTYITSPAQQSRTPNAAPKGTTWAHVAGNNTAPDEFLTSTTRMSAIININNTTPDHQNKNKTTPAIPETQNQTTPTPIPTPPIPVPQAAADAPTTHQFPHLTPIPHHVLPTPTPTSTPEAVEPEQEHVPERAQPTIPKESPPVWEPIDTSHRIRLQHCRACWFCGAMKRCRDG
ncbi:hypothetical protein BDW02DRAFT_631734 [Decorospora gaudefroyi]|uniref:RRM domain-containing protein n=1 Tax=Decorospora gaudefroyi TaxID=184978 RepID=A0A6A5KA48_9PLEO|nr:hypothetical protein BDW02DRAFT_631734 [Decorospora gaudefroyi]